jgi:transcriptional regulator with XRE-family HTH domain
MDATIWQNDTVRAAVAAGNVGAIVRAVREASNLTLAQLAQRCDYSISTLSRMERGKQPLRDVRVLRALAAALRIPPHVLGVADTPQRSVPIATPTAKVGPNLTPDEGTDPMRRRTLLAGLTSLAGTAVVGTPTAAAATDPVSGLEALLLNAPPSTATPTTLPALCHAVNAARSVFQHGRYAAVSTHLLQLLPIAHSTRDAVAASEEISVAEGQLAELYTLATEVMVKFSRDYLAAPAADRALQAAHSSGDILTQASARRTQAIVLRRAGQAATAHRLVLDSAAALQPDLHRGPEYLSVYGSLLSTAAYTAAVDGSRATAHHLISEAIETADRLGVDGNHRFTAFGPTGVRLYQISISRVLGDFGAAIDTARRVPPARIPLVERRARYWADVARSFHQWGKPEQCYQALLAAEQAAPDEVRYRQPIQHITRNLLRHPTATNLLGLGAFASRVGLHS